MAYGELAENGVVEPEGVYARAREAADRALSLDPGLGEAQCAAAYLKAIAAAPGFAPAHRGLGMQLLKAGAWDDAIRELVGYLYENCCGGAGCAPSFAAPRAGTEKASSR